MRRSNLENKDRKFFANRKQKIIFIIILPILLLMLYGAAIMAWDTVSAIPDSIKSVTQSQPETTCQTLLKKMKSTDDGYEAMVDNCLGNN